MPINMLVQKNSKDWFSWQKDPLTKETFIQIQICEVTVQIPWINTLQLKDSTTAVFPSKTVFLNIERDEESA